MSEDKEQMNFLKRWFMSEYYGMSLTGLIKKGFTTMAVGFVSLPSLDILQNSIAAEFTTSWFKHLVETTKLKNITIPEAGLLYLIMGPVIACEALFYMIKNPILKKFRKN